jgi:hypothetical protein
VVVVGFMVTGPSRTDSAATDEIGAAGRSYRTTTKPSRALEENDMTATYTFDVFSSLDGYGDEEPAGNGGVDDAGRPARLAERDRRER